MFRLFKKKYVYPELKWPSYAREMTEYEKRFVVNGGGAMTPEDQYNIAEAYRTGDQGKVDEIMSHYQNSGSGTTTTTPPTTSNTTPTTTTPPASVPTTPPANTTPSSSSSNNNGSGGFSGGGSGSSGGGSGSGGSSGSGSGSGSGGNSSPSSTSTTTTSQHKPSVSEQEGYLKAGLSHVEDYKKAARKTLGIRGSSVTGSSFKGKEVKGWRNNGDGTHTVTAEGATLWDRYGPNWRELSHYEGDPTKLHVGDTVGKKIKVNPGAGEMTVTEMIEREKKKEKTYSTKPMLYNPNDPNPDKRYNGQYCYNEQTKATEHLMVVNSTDTYNYGKVRDYYLTVGQYGSAETTKYDGIGITNSKGQMIEILRDEKSIAEYSQKIGMPVGTFMDTVNAVGDFAGNASTATGVANDVMGDIIAHLDDASAITTVSKYSKIASGISFGSGIYATGVDIKEALNNPNFDTISDVVIDMVGFIPEGGALASAGLSLTKEGIEKTYEETEKMIQYQVDYKFKDAFIPQSQNMMDNSYLTMKAFNYGVNLLFGRR